MFVYITYICVNVGTDAEQENAASFTSDAQVIEMSEALLKNPIFPSGSSFKSNEQTKPLTSRVTKKGSTFSLF